MNWQARGLCRNQPPELWFAADDSHDAVIAKRICAQCPVKLECRQWALDHREQHGVWGGLTEAERRRFLRTGTTLVERRCKCGDIFETLGAKGQAFCSNCQAYTAEGRRERNRELKRLARARARDLERAQ